MKRRWWQNRNNKPIQKVDLSVSISEAFEMGRIEGLKEAFREMKELAIISAPFMNYISARLKSLDENIKFIKQFKRIKK